MGCAAWQRCAHASLPKLVLHTVCSSAYVIQIMMYKCVPVCMRRVGCLSCYPNCMGRPAPLLLGLLQCLPASLSVCMSNAISSVWRAPPAGGAAHVPAVWPLHGAPGTRAHWVCASRGVAMWPGKVCMTRRLRDEATPRIATWRAWRLLGSSWAGRGWGVARSLDLWLRVSLYHLHAKVVRLGKWMGRGHRQGPGHADHWRTLIGWGRQHQPGHSYHRTPCSAQSIRRPPQARIREARRKFAPAVCTTRAATLVLWCARVQADGGDFGVLLRQGDAPLGAAMVRGGRQARLRCGAGTVA